MPEDREQERPRGYTRRSFLGKFSLGLATLAGAGFLVKNFLFSGEKGEPHHVNEFPGEDSIFHPRRDPHLDAIERRRKT